MLIIETINDLLHLLSITISSKLLPPEFLTGRFKFIGTRPSFRCRKLYNANLERTFSCVIQWLELRQS